jgi:hypothetical protein
MVDEKRRVLTICRKGDHLMKAPPVQLDGELRLTAFAEVDRAARVVNDEVCLDAVSSNDACLIQVKVIRQL